MEDEVSVQWQFLSNLSTWKRKSVRFFVGIQDIFLKPEILIRKTSRRHSYCICIYVYYMYDIFICTDGCDEFFQEPRLVASYVPRCCLRFVVGFKSIREHKTSRTKSSGSFRDQLVPSPFIPLLMFWKHVHLISLSQYGGCWIFAAGNSGSVSAWNYLEDDEAVLANGCASCIRWFLLVRQFCGRLVWTSTIMKHAYCLLFIWLFSIFMFGLTVHPKSTGADSSANTWACPADVRHCQGNRQAHGGAMHGESKEGREPFCCQTWGFCSLCPCHSAWFFGNVCAFYYNRRYDGFDR